MIQDLAIAESSLTRVLEYDRVLTGTSNLKRFHAPFHPVDELHEERYQKIEILCRYPDDGVSG